MSKALTDADARGIAHTIITHEPVTSVEGAAAACGVEVADVVKTLVVRRAEDDHVLVLVPGDRSLSWKKLRAVLGTNRLSLPDAETALAITGYRRGTITPLGLTLPVIADQRIVGRDITLGTGIPDTAIALSADALITSYAATVADVTDG